MTTRTQSAISPSSETALTPMIAVVNPRTEGSDRLRAMGEAVKAGIRAAGGTPVEFATWGGSDAGPVGEVGSTATLISREALADAAELVVRGQALDGVVMLTGSDTTIPAAAMALSRLDMPGLVFRGRSVESEPAQADSITTALMQMGLVPNFDGTDDTEQAAARRCGEQVMGLVRSGTSARSFVTRSSCLRAATDVLASGGNTSEVLHLLAIASEAGADFTLADFGQVSLDDSAATRSGIRVLHGSLAPEGAVTAVGDRGRRVYMGPARVFDSEWEAVDVVNAGEIESGDVIVVRGQGPRGGPGMPEMASLAGALAFHRMDEDVAVITDGRFSGSSRGVVVGHVSPEAAAGGPLAFINDGDPIRIDVREGRVDVLADLEGRWPSYPGLEDARPGAASKYVALVSSASTGAVTSRRQPSLRERFAHRAS